ncbi:MAG: hypothetical protein IJ859_08850 [Synergistaceae bacterium]|nr:hypothetical protein [Synergistaceae bacterium]
MEKVTARCAEVVIVYEGKDITRDLAPYLISFTYTDNASDKADDIALTLENKERLWINDWIPAKGDKIQASILLHDWDVSGEKNSLPCGLFEVDEITASGPPNVVNIKAVSTLISKPMRQEKHTQAWEDVRLSAIAEDFANKNGLKLFWDCSEDPYFERRDQAEKSDLDFIAELGRDYGIKTKVTDTQLVLYNGEEYENKDAIYELKFDDKKLLSWSFKSKSAGTYKAARLQYHNHVKNENIDILEESEDDIEGTGRTLEINQRADSISDAKKIAGEKLKNANKKEITGNINLMGDLRFVGGSNITISGFGMFDGKYVIDKAVHTISSSYTTKLDLSMGEEAKKKMRNKKKVSSNREVFHDEVKKVYTKNE